MFKTLAQVLNRLYWYVSTCHVLTQYMPKLTRKQLAEAENVSVETVINWEEQGIIPFLKIGHVVRFDAAKVAKALEKFERTAAK